MRIPSGIAKLHPPADGPTGQARVIDGDTVEIAGVRVRLHGLDAPELDQTFWCKNQRLACGAMAWAALEALTAGITLHCQAIGPDPYGRLVAKCFSPSGIDVGRRLVLAGWAIAYPRYSLDYVDAEEEARKAMRGLWQGKFIKPWEWRATTQQRGRRAQVR